MLSFKGNAKKNEKEKKCMHDYWAGKYRTSNYIIAICRYQNEFALEIQLSKCDEIPPVA